MQAVEDAKSSALRGETSLSIKTANRKTNSRFIIISIIW